IFFWKYGEQIASSRVSFREFGVGRFSRLYPLHFLSLLLVVIFQQVYWHTHGTNFIYGNNGGLDFAYQLLFASNWFSWQGYSFNGPIWSVSAEILIYFAFFGIVRLMGPSLMVAAMAAAVFLVMLALSSGGDAFLSSSVLACGLYFFVGGVLAHVLRR